MRQLALATNSGSLDLSNLPKEVVEIPKVEDILTQFVTDITHYKRLNMKKKVKSLVKDTKLRIISAIANNSNMALVKIYNNFDSGFNVEKLNTDLQREVIRNSHVYNKFRQISLEKFTGNIPTEILEQIPTDIIEKDARVFYDASGSPDPILAIPIKKMRRYYIAIFKWE